MCSSDPGPWRLFQAIESTLKFTDIAGTSSIFESRRLLHIDIFRKKTMKEGIADINLAQTPTTRNCQGKNQANRGWLHNRTKRVTVVNTMLLSKATSNETGLVLVDGAIRVMLGLSDMELADATLLDLDLPSLAISALRFLPRLRTSVILLGCLETGVIQ